MICNNCSLELNDSSKFCGQCGTKVIRERRCQECNTKLNDDEKFCFECGEKVKNVIDLFSKTGFDFGDDSEDLFSDEDFSWNEDWDDSEDENEDENVDRDVLHETPQSCYDRLSIKEMHYGNSIGNLRCNQQSNIAGDDELFYVLQNGYDIYEVAINHKNIEESRVVRLNKETLDSGNQLNFKDGKLYYATSSSIYSIDLSLNKYELLVSYTPEYDNYISNMVVIDDAIYFCTMETRNQPPVLNRFDLSTKETTNMYESKCDMDSDYRMGIRIIDFSVNYVFIEDNDTNSKHLINLKNNKVQNVDKSINRIDFKKK